MDQSQELLLVEDDAMRFRQHRGHARVGILWLRPGAQPGQEDIFERPFQRAGPK